MAIYDVTVGKFDAKTRDRKKCACIGISSRNFENFELFCPLGAMKLGVQQKK